jgi:cytosine deaminase
MGVAQGRFAALTANAPAGVATIDLGGALVVPAFVDGHIHLDKSFRPGAWEPHRPCVAGFNVRERVAYEREALARAPSVEQRALTLARQAAAHGSLHVRSHVDIDPIAGLAGLAAVLEVRAALADLITIQIVAFPQSGIVASPGTAALLEEAIDLGADCVGGLDPVSFDGSLDGHLDVVFGLAERKGVTIDIHLHDTGMAGIMQIEDIARRTAAQALGGRVTISHAYALGDVPLDVARRTGAVLAEAGVAIMTNGPGPQPSPPVAALAAEGVILFAGSDNVQDAWWPYGDADMLERAMMVGYRAGLYTDAELGLAFAMATTAAAAALQLPEYGLAVGLPANFVTLDAASIPEAVVRRPRRRDVWRRGQLVARNGELIAHQGACSVAA